MEKPTLVDQPSAAPSRKWLFGASGAAAMTALVPILYPALMAGLEAWSPEHAAILGPVIVAILTGLGFAVPAYAVRNRATTQQAIADAAVKAILARK